MYRIKKIKGKAEERDIIVTEVIESHTSSICPICHSKHVLKRKRLFKCLSCGLEAHRDAASCVKIGLAQGEPFPVGVINRV